MKITVTNNNDYAVDVVVSYEHPSKNAGGCTNFPLLPGYEKLVHCLELATVTVVMTKHKPASYHSATGGGGGGAYAPVRERTGLGAETVPERIAKITQPPRPPRDKPMVSKPRPWWSFRRQV